MTQNPSGLAHSSVAELHSPGREQRALAKHVRLTAARFLTDRATFADVVEACHQLTELVERHEGGDA